MAQFLAPKQPNCSSYEEFKALVMAKVQDDLIVSGSIQHTLLAYHVKGIIEIPVVEGGEHDAAILVQKMKQDPQVMSFARVAFPRIAHEEPGLRLFAVFVDFYHLKRLEVLGIGIQCTDDGRYQITDFKTLEPTDTDLVNVVTGGVQ